MPAPNQVWCGDITYIWAQRKWHYLAVVLDLYARRIVGLALLNKPDEDLVIKARGMAYEQRGRPQGLLFHSDQGAQGGFNRSSQHLDRGVYWTTRRMDAKIDGPGSDAFSRCTLTS